MRAGPLFEVFTALQSLLKIFGGCLFLTFVFCVRELLPLMFLANRCRTVQFIIASGRITDEECLIFFFQSARNQRHSLPAIKVVIPPINC